MAFRSNLYVSNVVVVVATQRFVQLFNVIAVVTMATCIVTYRRLYNICEYQPRTQSTEYDEQTVIKSSQKVVCIYRREYFIEPGSGGGA
jgi:hypothetical protein